MKVIIQWACCAAESKCVHVTQNAQREMNKRFVVKHSVNKHGHGHESTHESIHIEVSSARKCTRNTFHR